MNNWKNIIVTLNTRLLDVMEFIDNSDFKIVLVTENHMLVGTVTDGDIRRALLREKDLDVPIARVMNKKPVVGFWYQDFEKHQSLLKDHSINYLPILGEKNEIVNVVSLHQNRSMHEHKVVLMVGGLGTRLRPLTEFIPKPMLKIGERPILESIIRSFKNYGFHKFLLCVNYRKEVIQDYFQTGEEFGVEIEYIEEHKKMGTAGALSLLKDKIQEPFFVMNGDLITHINFEQLLDFHVENQSVATMCVRNYEYQIPFGVIESDGHQLKSIMEKPVRREYVNAGVYILNPEVLQYIPTNSYYDMPELFEYIMQQKKVASVFPLREYWMDIGQIADFEQANQDYERRNKRE
ncbi:nucleotidyltransferase family protein [Paenibacillus campi]|uniref:nucleotidyltransferase family protein n=1 Tax=Paenibacillus campi TaxID=3106031 RepID=UPI002AFE69C1|nr:nucleotidyltransferase family protein [Paenibacillus sp. SGZ-1014]